MINFWFREIYSVDKQYLVFKTDIDFSVTVETYTKGIGFIRAIMEHENAEEMEDTFLFIDEQSCDDLYKIAMSKQN